MLESSSSIAKRVLLKKKKDVDPHLKMETERTVVIKFYGFVNEDDYEERKRYDRVMEAIEKIEGVALLTNDYSEANLHKIGLRLHVDADFKKIINEIEMIQGVLVAVEEKELQ